MNIQVNINPKQIMERRGSSGKAASKLASSVRDFADKYVPYQSGILKKATIHANGRMAVLTYNTPYAHYQYNGKVMGKNILTKFGWRSVPIDGEKYYTGKQLTYQNALARPKWVEYAIATHAQEIADSLVAFMDKEAKK